MLTPIQYRKYKQQLYAILADCICDDPSSGSDVVTFNGYAEHTEDKKYYYERMKVLANRKRIMELAYSFPRTDLKNEEAIGILPYQNLLVKTSSRNLLLDSVESANHLFNLLCIAVLGVPVTRTSTSIDDGAIILSDLKISNPVLINAFGTDFLDE